MWYPQGQTRSLRQDPSPNQREPMTIISDLSDLIIEQVTVTTFGMITARASSPTAPCPCCGTVSKRVHSHYQRTLRDLPASGQPVRLVMQGRHFLCEKSTCQPSIIAERFPSLPS